MNTGGTLFKGNQTAGSLYSKGVYSKEIQQRLNQLAASYGKKFYDKVVEVLSQDKYKATGNLSRSIKLRIIPATDTESPTIELLYPEYGYILGARSAVYTRQAPADEILNTVKSAKFKIRSIPGYNNGSNVNISLLKIQKRVAYAIARSKYTDGKKRRYRWKREALPDLLATLNIDLTTAWLQEVENTLAAALTN